MILIMLIFILKMNKIKTKSLKIILKQLKYSQDYEYMPLPSPSPSYICQASLLAAAGQSQFSLLCTGCPHCTEPLAHLKGEWVNPNTAGRESASSLPMSFEQESTLKCEHWHSHRCIQSIVILLSCLDNRFPVILMNINHRVKWDLYSCSDWDILVLGLKRGWDTSRLYSLGSQGKWGLPEAASWAMDSVQVSSVSSGIRN